MINNDYEQEDLDETSGSFFVDQHCGDAGAADQCPYFGGIDRFLTSNGLNMGMLLAFAALIGFGGSFISVMMSKTMAKWSTGAQVIERPGQPV